MVGLILAAGEGKRLSDGLPEKTTKPLIKINHKHLIEYSLQNCLAAGIKTVIIVVNSKNKNDFISEIGEEYGGMKIIYAVQALQRGLINAVLSAYEYLNDSVLLQLSDEIFIKPEIEECIKFFGFGADFIVTCVSENDEEKIRKNFSVETDADGNAVYCVEKPEVPINNLKGTGLCIFSRECVELLKKTYNEAENYPDNLCDYFNVLTESNKSGKVFLIAEEEINVNTVSELNYAQMMMRDEIK